MMNQYRIVVESLPPREGGGYMAWVPDLRGCMSDGETVDGTIQNCREAIGEWIGHAREHGQDVPAPTQKA